MTDRLTPEAVKAARERVTQFLMMQLPGQPMMMHMGTSSLVNELDAIALDWLRLKEENAILRTEKHADAEAIAHLKELEKERDELIAALTKIRDQDVPPVDGDRPNVCVHSRTMDQECNLCTVAFARAAVEGK
jgi:hypothetical protein